MASHAASLLAPLLLASGASTQSINIDMGSPASSFGKPGDAHAAAAGQAGFWNAVGAGTPAILRYLDGSMATTKVVPGGSGAANAEFQNPLTFLADEQLMDDGVRLTGAASSYVFNVHGLANGPYYVYTYAMAPDTTATTVVTVTGSPDGARTCGGTWPGTHAEGVTYTRHFRNVTTNDLQIVVRPQGTEGFVNGLQIVRVAQGVTTYCFGAAAACPCGNAGGPAAGCENSAGTGGGRLAATGIPLLAGDTLALNATQLPPGTSALFFQGSTDMSAVFGDGLRCAGGTIRRLGTKAAPAGACSYPTAGDPAISVQGQAAVAQTLRYQVWYRNTAPFCTPAGFNLTNGVAALWQ